MTTLRFSDTNPAPDIHSDGFVETPDGFSIRYALFRSEHQPSKGTILLLQGRNETIEKYYETIADLGRLDFDVATFDWRGQGGSDRFFKRTDAGYVDSFDQYAIDLETVFEHVVLPDCRPPFFMLAHSTGALVALYTAPAMVNRIRRIVLSAPFLGLPVSNFRHSAMRAVTKIDGLSRPRQSLRLRRVGRAAAQALRDQSPDHGRPPLRAQHLHPDSPSRAGARRPLGDMDDRRLQGHRPRQGSRAYGPDRDPDPGLHGRRGAHRVERGDRIPDRQSALRVAADDRRRAP